MILHFRTGRPRARTSFRSWLDRGLTVLTVNQNPRGGGLFVFCFFPHTAPYLAGSPRMALTFHLTAKAC